MRLGGEDRPLALAAIVGTAIALLLTLSGLGILPGLPTDGTPLGCGSGCSTALRPIPPLQLGNVLAVPDLSQFWAVSDQSTSAVANSSLAAQVNATPIVSVRYDVGVDSTNQTADVSYSDTGVASTSTLNDSTFVTWCRWTHCQAILGVPGETNDTGAVASTIKYIERTLGFHPAYWSIGNEPIAWRHYGIPWTQWSPLDNSRCDATCYAALVQRLVPAMKSVDPSMKIIGMQDAYCGNDSYLRAVVALDGRNLSAVACHMYPASQYPVPTLPEFFGALGGSWGLPQKMVKIRAAIHYECPQCHLPMFLDEYNAAWFPIPPMSTYANAVFLGASIIEALAANVSQLAFFTLQDWGSFGQSYAMLSSSGVPLFPYYDYSVFAKHLALNQVVNASIQTSVGGVYAIETTNGTHRSLFIVNTNVSQYVPFTLNGSAFPIGGSGATWVWNSGWSMPHATTYPNGRLPSSWRIAPEGMFLLNTG